MTLTQKQIEAAKMVLARHYPPHMTVDMLPLENRLLAAYGGALAASPNPEDIPIEQMMSIPDDLRQDLIQLDEEIAAAAAEREHTSSPVKKTPLVSKPGMSLGKKLSIGVSAAVTVGGLAWGGFRLYRALKG